jgi:hypothetical protein
MTIIQQFRLNTIVIILALVAPVAASAQSATLEELREGVTRSRSDLADLQISYSHVALEAPPNAVVREEGTIQMQGSLYLIEQHLGDLDALNATQMTSFNGAAQWGYRGPGGTRMGYRTFDPSPTRMRVAGVRVTENAFFGLLRWYPFSGVDGQEAVGDLVERLSSDSAFVRDAMEEVQGFLCHVVDWVDSRSGRSRETIWIDPARGYLAVLQQQFTTFADGTREPYSQTEVVEALQVSDHAWIPLTAVTSGPPNSRNDESSTGFDYVFAVSRDASGNPLVRLNQNLPSEQFDCSDLIPAGTQVIDLDTSDMWIAGITDFKGMADAAIVALPPAEASAPIEPAIDLKATRHTDNGAPWRSVQWFAALGAAAAASVAMFLVRRFR